MSVELRFLGWDSPVTAKVSDFLLAGDPAPPQDPARDLVVVPTTQAGRRLRQALAVRGASMKTAVPQVRVVTPSFFLLHQDEDSPAAAVEVAAAWADVLLKADLGLYGSLFPARVSSQDLLWALRTGEMIEGLRRTLADGGCRMADVCRDFGALLEEEERWRDLGQLETAYLDRLGRLGLQDPCLQMLQRAETPPPPNGAERIVLAAVPDPTPLMVRHLERLAARARIIVLVHAPEALAGCFDQWGRPLPDAWRARHIDIPDPDANVLLCGSPRSQSRMVLELLAREADRFGPADVALGVPDEEVIPFLTADLGAAGLVSFNPAGKTAAGHPMAQLLRAFRDVYADRDYRSAGALMRNSEFLDHLLEKHRIVPGRVLEEMDRCQNEHLPQSLDDLVRASRLPASSGTGPFEFPALEKAVAILTHHVRSYETGGADASLRSFLQAVYETRTLRSTRPQDSDFLAVAEAVDAALHRLCGGPLATLEMDRAATLEMVLWALAREKYYPEPEDALIDLEGWLELPWNDAPFLIVTGMNEGMVPDSRPVDVFLPDSLRRRLKLRHEEDRLARDAYLATSLVESRREGGRVCFVAGKTGATGDVLRPSRLLFQCGDADLPRRAGQLFATPAEEQAGHPSTIPFRLEAVPPPDLPAGGLVLERIWVTAFRDYLYCPFRYYLKHVLGMKAMDDQKTELDAMDFGSMVHEALHRMALDEVMRRTKDVDRLREFLCAEASSWVFQKFGPSPPLQVQMQLQSAGQRLGQAARVQAGLLREGWEIVRTEMPIRGEVEGVQVRGKIDRIDRHRGTGEIRLLDYKTSEKSETPEAAHLGPVPGDRECPGYALVDVGRKQRRWTDLQVPLYAILLSSDPELRGPFDMGYFSLPGALNDTGVVLWKDVTPALLASAQACARGVITDIKNRRFWPPAHRVDHDEFQGLFPADAALCVNAESLQAYLGGEGPA